MPVRSILRAVSVVAIGALCATGCAREVPPDPVSSVDLQNGLAQQLVRSGTPAKWIKCPNSLSAQVGATTRCDVTFNQNDSVTALLTTIKVDGGKAVWEVTQAQLSKDQVAKRVAGITGAKNVDCESGLSGRVGSWVPCSVSKNGATLNQTVEITEAKGLSLKLAVIGFLPLQQVEDKVAAKLTPLYGRPPDQTKCSGELSLVPGSTIRCVATIDGNADKWAVTVTGVSDGSIDFNVERVPQRR